MKRLGAARDPSRSVRLRTYLVLLTVATILPVVVFAVVVATLAVQRERAVLRRGATERALALMTAVDARLEGHAKALEALASSENLARGDLREFHRETQRALAAQPDWRDVVLARASGEPVFEAVAPFGSAPQSAPPHAGPEWESFERALAAGRPVVGDLSPGAEGFDVRAPVFVNREVRYVLSARVSPASILELLLPQDLPPDWVGVVVDAQRRIVARTMNHQGSVGRLASPSLRRATAERPGGGWFRGQTMEGADVYVPYQRSPRTRWTVAIGIPAHVVEAAASQTIRLLGIGVLLASALAVGLSTWIGHRIAAPINSLASLARSVGRGELRVPPQTARLQETRDVSSALIASARAVREREEALRAADQAKDQFLAMLGHELRNPLSALTSAAGLLQMLETGDAGARSAVGVIERQVRHMTRLVDDLLDVSRVSAGKITLSREPLDLAACTEKALDVLRASGRLDHHRVDVDARPAWVDADAARIEQVVANLVGNAVKYTPAGGRITLRTWRRDGQAVLEVSDTGCGIAPDLLPLVFDLFVQDERSLDRSVGGLGIGLTLVRRLAELHGGRVKAESAGVGRGARFTVELPAIVAPSAEEPGRAPAPAPVARRRVLLVEDNDDARATLRSALERQGHEVHEASDGARGLEVARLVRPEVAVIDIGLPELDGYEVAQRLRRTPEGAQMLLIALTGYGQREVRRQARESGFDAYLTKPVSPQELTRRIDAALAQRARHTGRAY